MSTEARPTAQPGNEGARWTERVLEFPASMNKVNRAGAQPGMPLDTGSAAVHRRMRVIEQVLSEIGRCQEVGKAGDLCSSLGLVSWLN